MAIKMTNEQCEQAVRGNLQDILEQELEKLRCRLETSAPAHCEHIQGRIMELRYIMGLKEKARLQLL